MAPKLDSIVSFVSVIIFAAGFMIGGARLLHTAEVIPAGLKLLEHQAKFLTDIRPWLLPLYDAGIFLAVAGTIYGAWEVWVRTTYEVLRACFLGMRDVPLRKVRNWVLLYVGVVAIALMWMTRIFPNISLIDLPTPAAIIGGCMTCGMWCLAMIWTDRKFLPKAYQMNGGLLVLSAISGIAMLFMGFKSWWDFGVKKMGSGVVAYVILILIFVASMVVMSIINKKYKRQGLM